MPFFLIAITALIAGLFTGLVGIGGVLLVPVLTQVANIPIQQAIPASLFALLIAGSYAAFIRLRHAPFQKSNVIALTLGSAIGAIGGASTFTALPPLLIHGLVAVLCVGSGINALLPKKAIDAHPLGNGALVSISLCVGYASAISGTGGPVMLIPILLLLRVHPAYAITLGLIAQVPITLLATALNTALGYMDWELNGLLATFTLIGIVAGSHLSFRVSGSTLTRTIACLLIGVGLWYGQAIMMIF